MTIIPTKCPDLNKNFRNSHNSNTPDLEVLVRYNKGNVSGKEKITGVICPEYTPETKMCGLRKIPCLYMYSKYLKDFQK
jgi:hypothetical protein